MKKRAVALFLSVLLLIALCPTVFAEDVPTSGKCGDNLTWRYDEGTKTLTISGTGPMDDYASDSFDEEDYDYRFSPLRGLKIDSLVIMPGVTSIGKAAFSGCSLTGGVTIPNSVTSIGADAFGFCTAMTSVSIPSSMTKIGSNAFLACPELESINVDAANQNYASVDGVLFSKDMTVLYRYPEAKSGACQIPVGVTNIAEYAFTECFSLTGVTIPEGVTNIAVYTFGECFSLTSVTIPSSVTSIGAIAFSGCDALKDVYYGGSESQWAQIDIDDSYDGNDSLTKAAIHYNSGAADPKPSTGFTDVSANAYYADAVKWAVETEVTNGYPDGRFGPDDNCTRAQIVTFLWRAYGEQEPKSMVSPFTDVTNPNDYYYKAVLWAAEKKITTGATAATFDPNSTCTRAEAVTFLYRAANKPAVAGGSTFTDVPANDWYTDAVKWAAENEIAKGSDGKFSPKAVCTRAHIVTFLYRDLA